MKAFKAGEYLKQGSYKSFQPNPINHPWIMDDMEMLQLLGIADRELVKRLPESALKKTSAELISGLHFTV